MIGKGSELSYFIGLNSIQKISVKSLDEIVHLMIDQIIDPKKIIVLEIWDDSRGCMYLSLFTNLRSLYLDLKKV